jgi:hypothetical protein
MPVILATWEADIVMMEVRNHPRQIVFKTLYPKLTKAKWNFVSAKS